MATFLYRVNFSFLFLNPYLEQKRAEKVKCRYGPQRLDRLWGPPGLLSNGYWGRSPR